MIELITNGSDSNNNTKADPTIVMRCGNKTYSIRMHFSDKDEETAEKKITKMLAKIANGKRP